MMVRWEGSWTPSETKQDRPNASETLEIIGFEPFLPDRSPGGKIFMYWTARCTRDPWLQSGACNPFGAYVPDDLRQAFPDIDKQSFPRTATIISAADKQRLYAEYQRANPSYFSRMGIQPRLSSKALQAPISQSSGLVEKPRTNLKLFSRGTEPVEQAQPERQGQQDSSAEVGPSSVASPSEGVDDDPAFPQVAITLDQPLHFISAKGGKTH